MAMIQNIVVLVRPAKEISIDDIFYETREIPPMAPRLDIYHKPEFMLSAVNTSGADKDIKKICKVIRSWTNQRWYTSCWTPGP